MMKPTMNYLEHPIRTFLDDLAARTPTPGGGSASALVGALGAALGNMAAAFTVGNKKFEAVWPQAAKLNTKLGELCGRFEALVQEDIAAYGMCCDIARAVPARTAEEREKLRLLRGAAREKATLVPEEIVDVACKGLQLVEELAAIANPNLASDLAVAAYFLEAAARGAGIQVLCNCGADDNKERSAGRRAAITERIQQCQASRERIHAAVMKVLKL
ncbi:MAG: cyclodeaminase/cyclohydrolase family protein [Planctomycetota bacterium]